MNSSLGWIHRDLELEEFKGHLMYFNWTAVIWFPKTIILI